MKPELDDTEDMMRLGFALLRATYVNDPSDEAAYDAAFEALVEPFTDEELEEGWSLVAGWLLAELKAHGERLGCGCGSAEWLDRVILGAAGH
jgi:hypothetical protein